MVRPLSHFLLSGIFLFGGWTAFSQPGGRPAKVAAAGIPEPELAVALNGALMVIAGVLLGLDIVPKVAATTLIAAWSLPRLSGMPSGKKNAAQGVSFS